MNTSCLCRPLLVVASLAVLTFSSLAGAEPPMRAARLGYATGTVSFSPAGEGDWVRAVVNRPMTRGDRIWVEAGSRAEVQLGGASIRFGSATSVTLLNVDDRMTQLQLSEGSLRIKVRRMGPGEAIEINTPNLAFYISRPGEYRINVDANGDSTAVRVISGRAEAYGDRASYALGTQQGYRFYGTGLSDYDRVAVASWRDDDLDRWSYERERRYTNSASARYVSYDVVGYEDLDAYGRWQRDPEYGQVWTPTRVSAGWAPFRDGHWSWVDPWGWTWVDDAPWGYAVSHYGRWANRRGAWVWVPGPQRERAVYAPAQVAFVGNFGGASVSVAIGGLIGWFALAPREIYQPSYQVSRSYFERINRSNAVVAPATVVNVYNTTIVNNTTYVNREGYANQRVRGGVVAVPAQAFTQSQPVSKASTQASSEQAAKGQVSRAAPVAPEKQSVQGGAPAASAQPTHRERRVVARTTPPPPPPAFAAQQQQLAARPGRPIDEAQRKGLKPAATVPAPDVSVVTAAKAPAAAPPAKAPAAKSPEERKSESARADRGRGDGRGDGQGRRTDAAKADAPKGEAAKAEAPKADTAKADAAKADSAKADAAKADAARAEAAKADAAKAEAARKDDQRKGDFAKRDRERGDRDRNEARKADAAKIDAAKGDAMKAEAAKAAAAKNEAARAEAAKADAARAEAAKADAVKAEAARIDAAKAAAAKADASRAEAAKAEAARAGAMKAEAAKAAAAKADAARADTAKADAARAEAAKAQAAKAQAAQAESAKAQAAKAQAAQAEAAKAQAAQAAAAKAQAAQAEAAKAAAAQAAAAKGTGAQGAAVKAELTDAEKAARRAARKARGEKDDDDKK